MRRLLDSALFWIALGGAVSVIGGIVLGVGAASAASGHLSVWSERWFDVGFGIVLVGGLMLFWALVLFLAHRHAAQHWCPDPEAHRLPKPSGAATPSVAAAVAADSGQLRSVPIQIRSDARQAIAQIEKRIANNAYGGWTEPTLRDGAWKKNRKSLAQLPGTTELLDSLEDSFAYVDRIKGFMAVRHFQKNKVQATDELPAALASLRTAEHHLTEQIHAIDARP